MQTGTGILEAHEKVLLQAPRRSFDADITWPIPSLHLRKLADGAGEAEKDLLTGSWDKRSSTQQLGWLPSDCFFISQLLQHVSPTSSLGIFAWLLDALLVLPVVQ